ncbi:condensation domain-containing protein [Anabaena cylindrica UHCC 0172]|uniref:phthiocerol/phthiodiolone dimycocerosyl transferase family protein n=1 Tax=Anabaena cylindrica TaxID=1165 RepID=UPI002B1FE415|nr:condensation domain-containing protein [Anabaena cylindrica]MEA5553646.1 condensation domain-containing protein [Anabaena cylindrica UHCC 0172]
MIENRKLIAMEQGMEIFNRLASSLNVVIISKIRGNLSEETVRQSLNLVQIRHPHLNLRIIETLNELYFTNEGIQKIPLHIIINSNQNHWEIVVDELNNQIDSNKYLLRVVLIKQSQQSNISYLITTGHHAIIDAISGIYLHSEILQYCSHILSNHKISNISKLPILPSLEDLIPKIACLNPPNQQIHREVDTLKFEKYLSNEKRRCNLVHRNLGTDLTQKIIDSCKKENITVHGALCAAMLLAVANKIKNKDKNLYLNCRSSVDLRKRLNPPVSDENIAMIVSALTSFHEIREDKPFWELAREVTLQIKEKLTTSEIYNVVHSYKRGTEFLLANPHKVPFSVFITNIGRVRIPSDYGLLKLEKISYALSLNPMGSVFAAAVATFEEQMILNFIYSEPTISKNTMEILIEKVIFYLTKYCQ